jgi:biotin operon repressor
VTIEGAAYHGHKLHTTKKDLELLYHSQGKSLAQIAAILGISKTHVWMVAAHLGIGLRSRSEGTRLSFRQGRKPARQKRGRTYQEVVRLLGTDPSLKLTQVAARVGVSKQRVWRIVATWKESGQG